MQLQIENFHSQVPNGAFSYFVSQNWESRNNPDNDEGTKLAWLKNIKAHLCIKSNREVWIWFDIYSIPQKDKRAQKRAVASLPYYAQLCTRILPLVRDVGRWAQLYNKPASVLYEGGPPCGDINTYYQRGWCRLELLCALCPKKFSDNTWRPGPLALRMIFHEDPENTESPTLGPRLTAEHHLKDPLDPAIEYTCCLNANYKDPTLDEALLDTHDCDRYRIFPVRRVVAKRFLEYVKSGSNEVGNVFKRWRGIGRFCICFLMTSS